METNKEQVRSISVRIIPHTEQRYNTLDDFGVESGGRLTFWISDTGNPAYNRLILIHALIEQLISSQQGVASGQIDEFDLAYTGDGEPGDEPDCPYRDPHSIGTAVERIILAVLGVPWVQYEAELDLVQQQYPANDGIV